MFESDVKKSNRKVMGERETIHFKPSTQDSAITWPLNSHFGEGCWTWISLMGNRKGLTVHVHGKADLGKD